MCASLAMRSELRSYDDEPDDDTSTDDESSQRAQSRRPVSTQPQPHQQQQQQTPLRPQDSTRRSTRDERSRPSVSTESRSHTQETYAHSNNPYTTQDSPREWDHPFYTTSSSQQNIPPPQNVPPPPPRPQKVGFEDGGDRYYDQPPRSESQQSGRTKESARQRLASAMQHRLSGRD